MAARDIIRDRRGQTQTIMTIITGAIMVLVAVLIFANVLSVAPKAGIAVTNETWNFNGSDSSTYTKELTHGYLVEGTVKVYNSSYTFTEDTDYTVDYIAGKITNMSTGAIGGHSDFANYTDTFGVDYQYEESETVATRQTTATIFYSAINLVVIGFIVLAAVFILAVVSRLRAK